jgi:DNA-binding Lrp family transcriptional regulator
MHALWVAPRAPWRELAAAIGITDQTVARRYRALCAEAGLSIVARLDDEPLGWDSWLIRLQCTPDVAGPVAEALAARTDTSWVRMASGGTEVICGIQTRTDADRDALLLDRLAGSRRVVGISAHLLLHTFSPLAWSWFLDALTPDEVASLAPATIQNTARGTVSLNADDETLLSLLRTDGRASAARLGDLTGWHESRVRRRIAQLTASGALQFDIDIDEALIGIGTSAQCWVTVNPAALAETGALVASHPEAPFVASFTGPANLLVSLACRDASHLYSYLTERLGQIPAVRSIETVPIIRTYKRTATVRRTPLQRSRTT